MTAAEGLARAGFHVWRGRRARGLTAAAFARELGIGRNTLGRLERGEAVGSEHLAAALLALGVREPFRLTRRGLEDFAFRQRWIASRGKT